jgi:1-acyl-sn-glycerol-3-phosphate acyltransferase
VDLPQPVARGLRWLAVQPWAWGAAARIVRCCFGLEPSGTEHVPAEGPVVFAGNHRSHYDGFFSTFAVYGLRRRLPVPVAWTGIREYPVLADFAASGLPFVWQDNDAGTVAEAAATVMQMVRHLRAGHCLVIHCEGQRNDRLGEFREGAAVAALVAGVPVVPFSLSGVTGLFDSLAGPERYTGNARIRFHAPLFPDAYRAAHDGLRGAARAMTRAIGTLVASAIA